ncbi:MAG TPA: hypothetical protein VIH42_09280, partial [Thermoguttaceae bacterium]
SAAPNGMSEIDFTSPPLIIKAGPRHILFHVFCQDQLHTAKVLPNMKLGLPINFGQALIKDGIVRVVNGLEE